MDCPLNGERSYSRAVHSSMGEVISCITCSASPTVIMIDNVPVLRYERDFTFSFSLGRQAAAGMQTGGKRIVAG
jgi:hypothetical protein